MKPKRFKDELPPANTPFWYIHEGENANWRPQNGLDFPKHWGKHTGHWTTDGITGPLPLEPKIPKLLGVEGVIRRGGVWWVMWRSDSKPYWCIDSPEAPSETAAIEAAIEFVEGLRNDLE